MISAAPFRDRVVHHALCNVTSPILESGFIFDSYANRKGKGTHQAIGRCQSFMRQYRYVLKADIQKYFPSIDHEILKSLLAQKIGCSKALKLINRIIDASNPQEPVLNYFRGDNLFSPLSRRKGLPIGNLTSQLWANSYLNKFDHYVKEVLGVGGYVRYVDDFLLFSNCKTELTEFKIAIQEYLGNHLRLKLQPNKTQMQPTRCGLNFLGQRVYKNSRFIQKANLRRMKKRLRKQLCLFRAGLLTPDTLEAQLNAWLGHARQADMARYVKQLARHLYFDEGLLILPRQDFVFAVLDQGPNKSRISEPRELLKRFSWKI